MRFKTQVKAGIGLGLVALLTFGGCSDSDSRGPSFGIDHSSAGAEITLYSGRNEHLVGPAIEAFTEATGIEVRTRYAKTGAIAAAILEEGRNTPADVVLLQDAGALGALSAEGVLDVLPDQHLQRVDAKFRSPSGDWIGTSGRARVVVYNTQRISPKDLPDSILGFTDSKWKGRIGWPPANGSFQAFVTALRVQLGEGGAREWIKGVAANTPTAYSNNTSTVAGVAAGEVDVGFVNHYYLHRFLSSEGESFTARNFYYDNGDPGALVNVAGVGIVKGTENLDAARVFVQWMLSEEAQTYFSTETFEFPLVRGIPAPEGVPSLSTLAPPDIDLSDLRDLRGTQELLRDEGVLS